MDPRSAARTQEDEKPNEVDTGRLMPPPTPPLLALLESPPLRVRVRTALRLGNASAIVGPAAFAEDWSELRTLAKGNPGSPALVDTFRGPGSPLRAGAEGAFSTWARATPVICFARKGHDLKRRMNRAGITVAAHLRPRVDDRPDAINAAILAGIDMQRTLRLRKRVRHSASPFAADAFGHALDLAFDRCPVSELAERLGTAERTLRYHCRANRTPSPLELLSLARIFTVQRLGDWSRRPYGAVAVALGFSHRANYRRLTRRVLGLTPTALRRRGSHDYVAPIIIDRLS